jgi:arginase family enzyme
LDEIRCKGVVPTFEEILARHHAERAVFWGFDMDAVRSSDAPGVSAGYPVGFTGGEICEIARLAASEPRTRLLEISECNPRHDIDGRTSRLAAMMIVSFLDSLDG